MELAEDIAKLSDAHLHALTMRTAECTHRHWQHERSHVLGFMLFDLMMQLRRERVRRCTARASE